MFDIDAIENKEEYSMLRDKEKLFTTMFGEIPYAKYVFIEKLAFGDPFKVTKLNDKADLIEMLSERSDYTVEEGEPAPAVYENDKLIGKLKR